MRYKENWSETKQRFELWWQGKNTDTPLMRVVAKRDQPLPGVQTELKPETVEQAYLDVAERVKRMQNQCLTHTFLAEAFPNMSMDLGPGSMALYLGAEPAFSWSTVWYKECVSDWQTWGPLRYDPDNHWWLKHQELIGQAKQVAGDDFLVNIPDIIENLDILAAMRGPQTLIYDMMDHPDLIKSYLEQVDDYYFQYYDRMYDLVKGDDQSSSFTAFQIWGEGKTAKIQCDFCAMLSPNQFREFVVPSLRKQCQQLNHSLYHLDGPDAIRHVEALMEIEELDALQWTCGAGQPDGASTQWYPIYDKVREAGKSLHISIYDGNVHDWRYQADQLVKRYGAAGLYLLFPTVSEADALILLR